jgi:hypothetical protein
MTKTRFVVITIAMALAMLLILSLFPVQTEPKPAGATPQPPFDHSNCQYPDRWTNPPRGCDNSDPAVPECIKAFSTKEGEEACIREFVKANDPAAAEPIFPEPTYTEGK